MLRKKVDFMTIHEFLALLDGVRPSSGGWMAKCPAHDDRLASLSVRDDDGTILLYCHAHCETASVVQTLGLEFTDLFDRDLQPIRKFTATPRPRVKPTPPPSDPRPADDPAPGLPVFVYKDGGGEPLYRVVRYPEKDFKQHHYRDGRWWWGLGGAEPVPYDLPALALAVEAGETIHIPEGEKDCHTLWDAGFFATTNSGGSGKWRDGHSRHLKGARVVILPDNDQPGEAHANLVAKSLQGVASSVHVLRLPDLPPKGDVTDWFSNGGTPAAFEALSDAAPRFEPPRADRLGSGFDAAELLGVEFPDASFLVPGLIPSEGLIVFAGGSKIGKSFGAMQIGVGVASGGKLFGTRDVERSGRVLYYALEDGPRRLKKRLQSMLPPGTSAPALRFETKAERLFDGFEDNLRADLDRHPDTRLVIIDTLQKIRPKHRANGNVYAEDYDDLSALKSIADDRGVCLLVIHHTRKAKADDAFETISGSTGIQGVADTMWVLRKTTRMDKGGVLSITGRDIEGAELAMKFHPAPLYWVIEGDAEEVLMSDTRTELVRALRAAAPQGLTPTEAANRIGKPLPAVKSALWRMYQDGSVASAYGRYTLTDRHTERWE